MPVKQLMCWPSKINESVLSALELLIFYGNSLIIIKNPYHMAAINSTAFLELPYSN